MKSTRRQIIDLALPSTLENTLQASIGFVDAFIVTRLGVLVVSSVSLANSILAIYLAIFIALSIAASSMVARYTGANKPDVVKDVASKSLIVSLVFGVILALLTLLFGEDMIRFIGGSHDLLENSNLFLSIVGLSLPFMAYTTVGGALIRSKGDTRKSLLINGFANIINVILDIILVFGVGPLPALGILGTALGTTISKVISAILVYKSLNKIDLNLDLKLPLFSKNTQEFIALSVPSLLERIMMRVGQVVYFGMILSIGINTYAAHMLVGNIETFNYMPAYGLASAVTVLVGNAVGKNDLKRAKAINAEALKIGVVVMGVLGVVLFVASSTLASIFSNEPEVTRRIVIALKIDGLIQPFLAVSIIVSAALQASGDTPSPLIATTVGIWIIRVLGIYFFSIVLKGDILGIWITLLIEQILKSIYLTHVFKNKH